MIFPFSDQPHLIKLICHPQTLFLQLLATRCDWLSLFWLDIFFLSFKCDMFLWEAILSYPFLSFFSCLCSKFVIVQLFCWFFFCFLRGCKKMDSTDPTLSPGTFFSFKRMHFHVLFHTAILVLGNGWPVSACVSIYIWREGGYDMV